MLRFFNPAVLAPDNAGIIENAITARGRRNMMLITKMLQNLANGIQFDGLKEEYVFVSYIWYAQLS